MKRRAKFAVILAGAWAGLVATGARAACPYPPLTPPTLNTLLAAGQMGFTLDDEGTAQSPLYLVLNAASLNANNGNFVGTIYASLPAVPGPAPISYGVTGTIGSAGDSVLEIGFAFTVATNILGPGGRPVAISGTNYTYSGAITFLPSGQQCNLFLAGTYTAQGFHGEPGSRNLLGPVTGPFPFSSGRLFLAVAR